MGDNDVVPSCNRPPSEPTGGLASSGNGHFLEARIAISGTRSTVDLDVNAVVVGAALGTSRR
jgi:hypothetical protein